MVVLLTIYSLCNSAAFASNGVEYLLAFATGAPWLYFAANEARQAASSKTMSAYIFDIWNVMDMTASASIAVAFALRYSGHESWSISWFAAALPLNYSNILYYMQGFEESGRLVRMILGILKVRGAKDEGGGYVSPL